MIGLRATSLYGSGVQFLGWILYKGVLKHFFSFSYFPSLKSIPQGEGLFIFNFSPVAPTPDNLVIIYVRYHEGGREGKGCHKLDESEFFFFLNVISQDKLLHQNMLLGCVKGPSHLIMSHQGQRPRHYPVYGA